MADFAERLAGAMGVLAGAVVELTMLDYYRRLSLKAKLTWWACTIMALVVVAVSSLALWAVRSDMQRSVAEAQAALADGMAQDLENKLSDRRNALQLSAAALGMLGLRDKAALQAHFAAHPLLGSLFDSVFSTDESGRIVFDSPPFPGREGLQIGDRDYFRLAMSQGQIAVSEPLVSKTTGEPNVVFAAPMRDQQGRTLGVLCGVVYLSRVNFLTALTALHVGKAGHVALVSRGDNPRVVSHAQRDRIDSPLDLPALKARLHQSPQGVDGLSVSDHATGMVSLLTSRQITGAPWTLLISYPADEAYARMYAAQRNIVLMAGALLVLAGLSTWWWVARLMRPLSDLRQAMVSARDSGEVHTLQALSQSSELRSVVQAYNDLMAHHTETQKALRASELRLRMVADNLPAQITHIDTELRYTYVNATVAHDLGLPPEAVVGRLVAEVRGEVIYQHLQAHLQAALNGELRRFEGDFTRNGRQAMYLSYYVPDRAEDGQVRGVYAMSFDITEHKRAERRKAESEERVRSILTHAPDAFVSIDADGRVTEWNRQAELTFGWERAEAIGRDLGELIVPPDLRAAHAAGMARFVQGGPSRVINQRLELPALRRDGATIPVELSVASVREGDRPAAHAFLRDITERRAAQERLASSEKRLRDITDNLPVLIAYVDHEERVQFANETYRSWLGIDPSQILGRHLREVMGRRLYALRQEALQRALRGERVQFESQTQSQGVPRDLHTVYMPDRRADGRVLGLYALSTDVTELKQVQLRLDALARVDALTGLPNRRSLDERLLEALGRSQRHQRPLAVMFLDVDRFKPINDTHGHGVGDEVLNEFARRLTQCVRQTDTVARLAGDEFVILLEDLRAADEAEGIARKIGQVLVAPFVCGDLSLRVTASIGVAQVPGHASLSPAELLAQADAALYEAKRRGRNTYALSTQAA